jgi:hypothetical protein
MSCTLPIGLQLRACQARIMSGYPSTRYIPGSFHDPQSPHRRQDLDDPG